MLDFILHSPALADDAHISAEEKHKLGHVVPFAATEIITSEIKTLIHQFFYKKVAQQVLADQLEPDNPHDSGHSIGEVFKEESDNELYLTLLKFLDSKSQEHDSEVNSVLAGYFEKIFQVLVGHYPQETYTTLYTEEQGQASLHKMVKLCSINTSVANTLEKCLNFSETCIKGDAQAAVKIRNTLIHQMIEAFFEGDSGVLTVLKGLQAELVQQVITEERTYTLIEESEQHRQKTKLLYFLVSKQVDNYECRQKLEFIIEQHVDTCTELFTQMTAYQRVEFVELLLLIDQKSLQVDVKALMAPLVQCFVLYPLQDTLLQNVSALLLQKVFGESNDAEDLILHMLFETDFVKVIMQSLTHMHNIGLKLKEMAATQEDIQEYLGEFFSSEWPEYLVRLQQYLDVRLGCLTEDPRNVEKEHLSDLLGLKFQTQEEIDQDDDFQDAQLEQNFGLPLIQANERTSQDDFDRLMAFGDDPGAGFGSASLGGNQLTFANYGDEDDYLDDEAGDSSPKAKRFSRQADDDLMNYCSNDRAEKYSSPDSLDQCEQDEEAKAETDGFTLSLFKLGEKSAPEHSEFYQHNYWRLPENQNDLSELLLDYS